MGVLRGPVGARSAHRFSSFPLGTFPGAPEVLLLLEPRFAFSPVKSFVKEA